MGVDRANLFPARATIQSGVANLNGMTGDFRAQLAKKEFGERACGHASRSFAGGSALQNVAGIVKIKFLSARKSGVTRPRRKQPSLMVGGFGRGPNGWNFSPFS